MCTFLVNHKLSKPSLFSEEICGSVCAPLLLLICPFKDYDHYLVGHRTLAVIWMSV